MFDDISYSNSMEQDKEEKITYFDEYQSIAPVKLDKRRLPNPILKLFRVWNNFCIKLSWRKEFLKTIDLINPDLCILITTLSPNGKMACMYRPGVKKVLIQASGYSVKQLKNRAFAIKLRDWIYEWVFMLPIVPTYNSSLNNTANVDYLLWSELWIGHVQRNKNSNYLFLGAPGYDQLFKHSKHNIVNRRFKKCLVILNKERIIGMESWFQYIYFYQEVVAANPDIDFIFKVHPLGNFEEVRKLFPDCYVTQKSYSITDADCVLTHWSTLAIETMVLKIPILLINPDGQFDFHSRYLSNYRFIIEDPSVVNIHLENIKKGDLTSYHNAAEEFLKLSLTYTDGNSTERIINHLKSL